MHHNTHGGRRTTLQCALAASHHIKAGSLLLCLLMDCGLQTSCHSLPGSPPDPTSHLTTGQRGDRHTSHHIQLLPQVPEMTSGHRASEASVSSCEPSPRP